MWNILDNHIRSIIRRIDNRRFEKQTPYGFKKNQQAVGKSLVHRERIQNKILLDSERFYVEYAFSDYIPSEELL